MDESETVRQVYKRFTTKKNKTRRLSQRQVPGL